MTLFPVLVDVYHKEQLVTKEEAEEAASDVRRWDRMWVKVAHEKDVFTAARIAEVLVKYGFNDIARHVRSKCVFSGLCV